MGQHSRLPRDSNMVPRSGGATLMTWRRFQCLTARHDVVWWVQLRNRAFKNLNMFEQKSGDWKGHMLFVNSSEKREISNFPDWNRSLAVQFVARRFRYRIIYKFLKIDMAHTRNKRGTQNFDWRILWKISCWKQYVIIKTDLMEVSCRDVKLVESLRWTAFMQTDLNLWVA
jgi:hypothetical protein